MLDLHALRKKILFGLFLFLVSFSLNISFPEYALGNNESFMQVTVQVGRDAEIRINGIEYSLKAGSNVLTVPLSGRYTVDCCGQKLERSVRTVPVNGSMQCRDLKALAEEEIEKIRSGRGGSREMAGIVLERYYTQCRQVDFKLPAIILLALGIWLVMK